MSYLPLDVAIQMSLTSYTNRLLQRSLANNSCKLDKSKITTIHPEIYLKYSSVNVFLGKQGTGKTFTLNKELVKLSLVPSDIHLIVVVTKDGRQDETFESIKDNITIPVVYVSYDNIIEYIHELVFYKMIYDKIISNNLVDQIEEEQLTDIQEALHLDGFTRKSLQEIIVFDDAAYKAILTDNASEIISMIHEARHYKLIFCFCVQGIKAIPLPIKEQMTTLFLFPGFIQQKLFTIFNQSGITCVEYDEFRDLYRSLLPRDYLLVDCQSGSIRVVNGDLNDQD